MDGSFKSLLDNWNSDIITDLQIIQSTSVSIEPDQCPQNYESFLSYFWSGTQKICQCSSDGSLKVGRCCRKGQKFRRVLRRGSGGGYRSSSSRKCQTCFGTQWEEREQKTFDKFQYNGIKNYRICVKRLKGYNFFAKAQQNGKGQCPIGFKSSVSDPINQFCVPEQELEPIRSFEVNWVANQPQIIINRNQEKTPLVQLTCQKGTGVCLDWKVNTAAIGERVFPFLKEPNQNLDDCQKDFRWKEVENWADNQMNEKEFFRINFKEYSELNFYTQYVSETEKMQIFQRGIIPFSTENKCRDSIEKYQDIYQSTSFLSDWLIVAIVFSSIFALFSLFECFLGIAFWSEIPLNEQNHVRYGMFVIPWKPNQEYNSTKITLFSIKMAFLIVLGIALGLIFSKNIEINNFCNQQISQCFKDPNDLNIIIMIETKTRVQNELGNALFIFYLVRIFFEPTIFQILKIIFKKVFRCKEEDSIQELTYHKQQTFTNCDIFQNTEQAKMIATTLPRYNAIQSKKQIIIDRGVVITPEKIDEIDRKEKILNQQIFKNIQIQNFQIDQINQVKQQTK